MENIQKLHARFCEFSLVFKGNRPRTVKSLRDNIRGYLLHTRHEDLAQITREAVQNWIIWGKTERGWSAKTIRNQLQGISSFMEWCVDESFCTENPVKKIPRPKLPKSIPKHLSIEDAMKVMEWTKNFHYAYKFDRCRAVAIIGTFMYTGIRLQELRNLRMIDVDLVDKSLLVKSGKGDKDRVVPLNNKLIEILQEYLKERVRLDKTCPYFFTAMREDDRMGDLVIKRLIIKLRNKCKIPFYAHLLRHTFATLMLEGGCDLFSLSKMLGHSDIKTTTIYLSATKAHLQGQIEKHPLSF